jgi:hypothetical protein
MNRIRQWDTLKSLFLRVLNSTDIALASGIDPALISFLPDHYIDETGEGSFILIDPSLERNTAMTAQLATLKSSMERQSSTNSFLGTFTPKDTIKHAISLASKGTPTNWS